MAKVVIVEQMSDLRNLEFVEITVDWKTMTVWANGPYGCLFRAVKCKNILIKAEKSVENWDESTEPPPFQVC